MLDIPFSTIIGQHTQVYAYAPHEKVQLADLCLVVSEKHFLLFSLGQDP